MKGPIMAGWEVEIGALIGILLGIIITTAANR